jgi:hypothetical protein
MNYRVRGRIYWGGDCILPVDLGVYLIKDATRMMGYIGKNDCDRWLEPTEEPVYRIWCRDYRWGGAYVYPITYGPTGIGRAIEEVALLRQTPRDGEVGSDYWLVREEDEG